MLMVIKKNNSLETFNPEKIIKAIQTSANRIKRPLSAEAQEFVLDTVINETAEKAAVPVSEIHCIVEQALYQVDKEVGIEYRRYNNYKRRFSMSFENIRENSKKLVFSGDTENANKDSALNSTQKELMGGMLSKELMLQYELSSDAVKAHSEGWLYIHDLTDRIIFGINCCLFDMANVLKGGFEMEGVIIQEPKTLEKAIDLVSNIITNASSQQYGGFTIPELDTTLAKYAEGTYKRELKYHINLGLAEEKAKECADKRTKEIVYDSMESLEYQINLLNNGQGQTPFVSVSFGLNTSYWGRYISECILKVRINKMGENKMTAIFPKLIFLHRKEINGAEGSPNYDIKKLAIKCSMKNLYPDWLSLDNGYLGEVFDRSGKAISPMGCRAFLSPWWNEKGEETYIGRFNIGAITFNLPKMAYESNGDINKFYELLDKYFEIALQVHLYSYDKIGKKKASSNPLFFTQGGCAVKLKADEPVAKALECATASFGYIGLTETCYLLSGKQLHQNTSLAKEILIYIRKKVDKVRETYKRLFAFYGTPAEGLASKFLEQDKKTYGIIPGMTDKEWYTNSHHIDVTAPVSAFDKINIESDLFQYPTGGRIMYTEWNHTDNDKAIEQVIDVAMDKGLYFGINLENSKCNDCGTEGDFKEGTCEKCGSHNITTIDRVCGYLGISNQNGVSRYNEGKKHEVLNRVKHYNVRID